METIRIFIASSFELSDWRTELGDTIRQWSDAAEPYGYRIRMECWEDYHPEFTGERKQTEYNEDLIKPSNLFLALFRTRCGEYTKEEIRIAQHHVRAGVHVVRHLLADRATVVDDYIGSIKDDENISIRDVYTLDELITHLSEIVRLYIRSLPSYRKTELSTGKNIYATVGMDMLPHKAALGNLVRSLDNISESYLGMRCRMTRDHYENISKCDYYIGLLKDKLSEEDIREIHYAIANTNPNSHPEYSILYYRHGDKAIDDNETLCRLINQRGAFKEEFDSIHRVKYNLLVWLLSQRLATIDEKSGLNIVEGMVRYREMPIIPMKMLDIECEAGQNPLSVLLDGIRQKLLSSVLSRTDFHDKFDITQLDREMKTLSSISTFTEKLNNDIIDREVHILSLLNAQISPLLIDTDQGKATEILLLCIRKRELEESVVKANRIPPIDWIRTEILIVRLIHTFDGIGTVINLNEDLQYERIVKIADTYNIATPEIEAIRMNYGNYLSRNNWNKEAQAVYTTALSNLEALDDGSALMISYLPPLYLNQIHGLSGLGMEFEATELLSKFENKIDNWSISGYLPYHRDVYDILTLSARLSFRNTGLFKNHIKRGFELWNKIDQMKSQVSEEERIWDDVFGFFPITLAAATLDSNMPPRIRLHKAETVLGKASQYFDQNSYIEKARVLAFKAQCKHNLAFAYSNAGFNKKARSFALEALDYRKQWFAIAHSAEVEREIGSTLLMIGATYINGRRKYLPRRDWEEALSYAEESLSIFKRLNNGYLEQETQVYQAELLKGTVLKYSTKHQKEGVKLIADCYKWSIANPTNSYRETIAQSYHNVTKG